MHFYKHNIGDYRRDCGHLTLIEHGAYRQLLDTYYLHEEPLPLDHDLLFRRMSARTDEERVAIEYVLKEFFTRSESGYTHSRCDEEIAAYHSRVESARESGRIGGLKKANAKRTLSDRQATAKQTPSETLANHEPQTKNQVEAPDGVDPGVWSDFVGVRKKRRAAVTDRVIEGIKLEADKAGMSLNDALNECVVRGWQSFKAEWMKGNSRPGKDFDWDSELKGAV